MKKRSIKHLRPRLNSHYNQGYYHPVNEEKYVGPRPIIYRSGWEYEFSKYCDITPEVLHWSSEPVAIRYWNLVTKKFHTYFPDYVIKIIKDGLVQRFLVEVKPKAQLKKPKAPKVNNIKSLKRYKKASETYVVNLCKIDAMKKFAEANGYKVLLITEDSNILKGGKRK